MDLAVRTLGAEQLLSLWERGEGKSRLDQAMLLLSSLYPTSSAGELAELSIGACDARLIALREKLIGPTFSVLDQCPHCKEKVELSITTEELLQLHQESAVGASWELFVDGSRLRYRLPTSWDLAAAQRCSSVEEARLVLLSACVLSAEQEGRALPLRELSQDALLAVSEQISQRDPLSEVLVDLSCSYCGGVWQTQFEVVPVLWAELRVYAKRLLREVHLLGRAYGWSEEKILAMSPRRRKAYLEMIYDE